MPIDSNSRFITSGIYTATKDGKITPMLDSPNRQYETFLGGYTHRVIQDDTLENIANKYYGDSTKWWVIADANNIRQPLGLETGVLLNIPV